MKKRCPECGGRMEVEETATTGTRMPLVCGECGHVDLVIQEEDEDELVVEEKPKAKKIKPKAKRTKKK